jgi:polyphenol oxidase
LTLNSFHLDDRGVYRVAALTAFPWLEHGFGTGLSSGWPDESRLSMLRQIHSGHVVMADEATGYMGEGDALMTNRPGQLVGVRTADCVPILLVDSRKRTVAAIHAGWRGTAQRIALCTIWEMARRFGTTPSEVFAAIGPAIGPCCYEVGPEVARKFAQWWPELAETNQPVKLDLTATNCRQLIQAGVASDNLFTGAPCTRCTNTLHSYRRDKEAAGRMIAAIGILTEK